MNVLRKHGGLVVCVLMALLSAVPLEGSAVRWLGETVPRAILFGLGLFACWLAIWLLGFRVMATVWARARKPIADPVDRWRVELRDVMKIVVLGSCAMNLFIVFPWVQGFAMPHCSLLAVKLFWFQSLACGVAVAWVGLRLSMALRARKSACSSAEDVRDSGESTTMGARSLSRGQADRGTQSAFALP